MKNSIMKSRLLALWVGSAAVALASSPAVAQAPVARSFDIPAQSLASALIEYSRQSGQPIAVDPNLVIGRQAPAVRGTMSPEEALRRLLAGSGLRSVQSPEGGLALAREPGRPLGGEAAPMAAATELSEIVVTGTHIRGAQGSAGAKLDVVSRLDIDRAGFSTAQQVVQSLTQNFRSVYTEDRLGSSGNTTAGTGVNLRALGPSSTLVLLNGRRLPAAGDTAIFTDVSSIPASAIERVEVLPDGASALYGSDAVAGVVNFILRKDYEGAETRLRIGSVTDGGAQEYQVGQVFGTNWSTGNALIAYEYHKREELMASERKFTSTCDLRPRGGSNYCALTSNPGNIVGVGIFSPPFTFTPTLYGIPAGQDGTSLTPGDLLPGVGNYQNSNEARSLLPDQERHSVFASVNQELTPGVEVFAEGRFSQRKFRKKSGGQPGNLSVPSFNPFFVDPVGGSDYVVVAYNFLDDVGPLREEGRVRAYNGVLGSKVDLWGDWQLDAYGAFAQERSYRDTINVVDTTALNAALFDFDPATAFNPFGDGSHTNPATLAGLIADPTRQSLNSKVWSANAIANGSLAELEAGTLKMAIGADYRRESFSAATDNPAATNARRSGDRDVTAVFGELYVPVVGAANSVPGIERLNLSAALRYEHYNDAGSTTNPRFGVTWAPINDLEVRGTWGTAFRAPRLLDKLNDLSSALVTSLPDPTQPDGMATVLFRSAPDPELGNEKATTWTVGADWRPSFVPSLTVSLTYFDVDFKDRLAQPTNAFALLLQEDQFSSAIQRNPSQAEIDAICNSPAFNPIGGTCNQPIDAIIEAGLRNRARTIVRGIDGDIRYGIETASSGRFDLRLNATYLIDYKDQFDKGADVRELVDTVSNPIDFKMRNSLTWSSGNGLLVSAFMNYSDSYRDDVSIPARKIKSWTTFDLTLAYETGQKLGSVGLNDTTISFSVLNLFDKDPPFVNNSLGVAYDPSNADSLGRFVSLNLTKRW